MTISESHAAHIGRVNVALVLTGATLDPGAISRQLDVAADRSARAGDERLGPSGVRLKPHEEGFWRVDSSKHITVTGRAAKDVNEHIRCLLALFARRQAELHAISASTEVFFDVLWESSYLYAGTGPVIEPDCLQGMAALGASIGFDIYQIDGEKAG